MTEDAMHVGKMDTFGEIVRKEERKIHQNAIIVGSPVITRISADLKGVGIIIQRAIRVKGGRFVCIAGLRDMSFLNV